MSESSSSPSPYPPCLSRRSWKFAHVVPRTRDELENIAQRMPESEKDKRKQKLFEYVEDIYTHFLYRMESGGKMIDYMLPVYIDNSYLTKIETELKHLFPDCSVQSRSCVVELDDLEVQMPLRHFIRISLPA